MNEQEPICNKRNVEEIKRLEGKLDVGAEEFSEKIYDECAPTPPEFDEPHSISVTGAKLTDTGLT